MESMLQLLYNLSEKRLMKNGRLEMRKDEALKRLKEIDTEVLHLSHILGVLSWDQEVLPPKAVEGRGAQIGLLQRKVHALATSDELGEIVEAL